MSKRSIILSLAFLVLVLTAGAAQGLSGTNTVFTDDIVDGTIRHVDIKANSVGGSRLLDNSVTGADTNEASLKFPCGHSAGPSFASIDRETLGSTLGTAGVVAFRNCAGQQVLAKRSVAGDYCVTFPGSSHEHAIVTSVGIRTFAMVNDSAGSGACGELPSGTARHFQVQLTKVTNVDSGTLTDSDFTILAF